MRITFAPSDAGTGAFRTGLDAMSGCVARVWTTDEDPLRPTSVLDVLIRYASYSDQRNEIVARPYDREEGRATEPEQIMIVDRIHIY